MPGNVLWTLILVFVPLSFVTVGGGAAILAPLNRQAVDVYHWMSQRDFIDLFAISRAAPGPGSMLVALVGWKVARWAGALVAVVATFLPSSLLCYGVARVWNRYRGTRAHSALERGLAPVGTGLLMAGAFAILRAAHAGAAGWGIALGATAILAWRNLHPLLILFAGGTVYAAVSALSG